MSCWAVSAPPDGSVHVDEDDRTGPANDPKHPERSSKGVKGKTTYWEGVNVGYRWFEKNNIEPFFPFGYGLSYTKFEYSDLKATPATDGGLNVRFRLRNTGPMGSEEVPQVYLAAPTQRPEGVCSLRRSPWPPLLESLYRRVGRRRSFFTFPCAVCSTGRPRETSGCWLTGHEFCMWGHLARFAPAGRDDCSIGDPMRYLSLAVLCCGFVGAVERPPIIGVAQVTLRTNDIAAARSFYGHVLGFADLSGGTDACFKVNDHQYIEMHPDLTSDAQDRLIDIAFETTNAQQLHDYLVSRGCTFPRSTHNNSGDLSFQLTDPDAHRSPSSIPAWLEARPQLR